jgi:hypothetical protein
VGKEPRGRARCGVCCMAPWSRIAPHGRRGSARGVAGRPYGGPYWTAAGDQRTPRPTPLQPRLWSRFRDALPSICRSRTCLVALDWRLLAFTLAGEWPGSAEASEGSTPPPALPRATAQWGVGWLDWPCCQDSGRKPVSHRRALGHARRGAKANRVQTCGASSSVAPERPASKERITVPTWLWIVLIVVLIAVLAYRYRGRFSR